MRNIYLWLILVVFMSGCFGECSYQKQVAYVESFSEDRFSALFDEVSQLSLNVDEFGKKLRKIDIESSTEELYSMEFNYIDVEKEEARLRLGGCFDNKATLYFKGLHSITRSITLRTGDWETSEHKLEVIWEKVE